MTPVRTSNLHRRRRRKDRTMEKMNSEVVSNQEQGGRHLRQIFYGETGRIAMLKPKSEIDDIVIAALEARYPGIWKAAAPEYHEEWPWHLGRLKSAAAKRETSGPMPRDIVEAFCDCRRGRPAS